MSSLAQEIEYDFIATKVRFNDESLILELDDGREIKVPLEFYPRLNKASKKQRANYQIIGQGQLSLADLDEDLSVEGILLGIPAGSDMSGLNPHS